MELTSMDKFVQQTVHVEHTEMTIPMFVKNVTTLVNVVQEVVILIVPLVMMELIGMKENVEAFAQQDIGKMKKPILVKDVMEVVLPVPEETIMIVKNHAQKDFTGMMDTVSVPAQKVLMKMTPQSRLVNHVT